jgi:chlorite dismutase
MERLWYLLPQHAREQMLQSPAEEFAPKYELQIEEYFRRLSEETRGP